MNNNQDASAVQGHLHQFFSQLAQCPELEGELGPEDLPQLLEAGLAHVLKGALKRERELHLEDHPQDRANVMLPSVRCGSEPRLSRSSGPVPEKVSILPSCPSISVICPKLISNSCATSCWELAASARRGARCRLWEWAIRPSKWINFSKSCTRKPKTFSPDR